LLLKSEKLFIITSNQSHPAFELQNENNLEIIYYQEKIDFKDLFYNLKIKFKIDNLTIQT